MTSYNSFITSIMVTADRLPMQGRHLLQVKVMHDGKTVAVVERQYSDATINARGIESIHHEMTCFALEAWNV